MFSKAFETARALLEPDRIVLVKGRVDQRGGGETKLVAFEVQAFDDVPLVGMIRIEVDARNAPVDAIARLRRICEEYHGDHPVVVDLSTSTGPRRLRLGPEFRVRPDQALFAEISASVGTVTLA